MHIKLIGGEIVQPSLTIVPTPFLHGLSLLVGGETVVQRPADVGHEKEGTLGAVPDGLHPRDGPLCLQECHHPGPPAQLGPLHGPGLPTKRTPVGGELIPGGAKAVAGEASGKTITDGRTLFGSTESSVKAETAGG